MRIKLLKDVCHDRIYKVGEVINVSEAAGNALIAAGKAVKVEVKTKEEKAVYKTKKHVPNRSDSDIAPGGGADHGGQSDE